MDWQFILTRLAEPHVPAVIAIGLLGLALLGLQWWGRRNDA
jgi:hypothetical protein